MTAFLNTLDKAAPLGLIPSHSLSVYRADDFRVVSGANLGDPLREYEELSLDDTYRLGGDATRARLSVRFDGDLHNLTICPATAIGRVGAALFLDAALTFMSPDGTVVEAVALIETAPNGLIADTYVMALSPLETKRDYVLVRIDPKGARALFAQVGCVSFTRGTLITMGNGRQCPIERLKVGDKVLSRDNGPQEIRWIGQQTSRAAGALAPIVITKGALNNENDLIVSPNHRLFIYQRRDQMGTGRSEVLVKASLLVNGTTVVQSAGGFVDYFQLMFDGHEIIYAEGIAAESQFLASPLQQALNPDDFSGLASGHSSMLPPSYEILDSQIDRARAAELLRRASLG